MDPYEEKLKLFMQDHQIIGEHLHFEQSCHSVKEAAEAVNAEPSDLVKSICLIDASGSLIVAIVKGEDRVSIIDVAKALNIQPPKISTPAEILERTGYPCGGTPSFGYKAVFLIDERVMEKEVVYSGGGSENSLVKITPKEIQRSNRGTIAKIRIHEKKPL